MLEILWELIPCPFHFWCRALPTEPQRINKEGVGREPQVRTAEREREGERGRWAGMKESRRTEEGVLDKKKEKKMNIFGAKTVKNDESTVQM